ncbi:hypothetical protein DV096_03540 [Bradymonadaceae bacterium TMQ3]|nr:hypothetical protein DV096_03540 [Bradymonadaceae bacterium TMQ3]TXC77606.1 hypothetical protein FRC91_02395 [Bradymonadales bacterium TMQ1]
MVDGVKESEAMMRSYQVAGAALVGLAVGGAMMVGQVAEADACMPPPGQINEAYPLEGEQVAPEVTMWLFGSGVGQLPTIELRDADDELVATSVLTSHLASNFGVAHAVDPSAPLAEGTYTLRAQFENVPQNNFERVIEVDADAAWPAPPAPPALTWYRETHDQAVGNSCEFGDEHHRIALAPGEGAVVYRVEVETDVDRAFEVGPVAGRAEIEHGITLRDVRCVRAYAIRGDGTESEVSERCVPQKCRHYDLDESPGALGTTDWSLVMEGGCPGDPDEGDVPVGSDAGDDAGDDVGEDAGDDVGPGPGDDAGENPQQDVGERADTGSDDVGQSGGDAGDAVAGGGCSSTGGPSGGVLSLLLGALAMVWRRRR